MSKKRKNVWTARRAAALSCLLCLTTAACSASMTDNRLPTYRENPAPTQAHRLTLSIADAPGPLEVTVSAVQYDVINTECLPPPKDNPGGYSSPVPTYDIPVELERVSDTEYTGVFYTDGMLDEDYHGRGVCRWQPIQAQVQLIAAGTEGGTRFAASLSREQLIAGEARTTYYWKGRYPGEANAQGPQVAFGQEDRSRMAPALGDDDIFRISLSAKEVAP